MGVWARFPLWKPSLLICVLVYLPAPHASEPYLTLATIYEDMGDTKKLLQIVMIAAHLKRTDIDLWTKSANLAIEQQKFPMAAQCLSKGNTVALVEGSISNRFTI